jgi:hypothetical protein
VVGTVAERKLREARRAVRARIARDSYTYLHLPAPADGRGHRFLRLWGKDDARPCRPPSGRLVRDSSVGWCGDLARVSKRLQTTEGRRVQLPTTRGRGVSHFHTGCNDGAGVRGAGTCRRDHLDLIAYEVRRYAEVRQRFGTGLKATEKFAAPSHSHPHRRSRCFVVRGQRSQEGRGVSLRVRAQGACRAAAARFGSCPQAPASGGPSGMVELLMMP